MSFATTGASMSALLYTSTLFPSLPFSVTRPSSLKFRHVPPRKQRFLGFAERTSSRFPLRHVQIGRVIKRKLGGQFVHEGELPAVTAGKDHHPYQDASLVGDDLPQLAAAAPAR